MALTFTTKERAKHLTKHRVHTWVNIDTLDPIYGIESNVEYGCWAHVADGGKPMTFSTKEAAKAEIKSWVSA